MHANLGENELFFFFFHTLRKFYIEQTSLVYPCNAHLFFFEIAHTNYDIGQ